MANVANPIIIDQKYCDQKNPCSKQQKAVQMKNVLYKSISGTSASQAAIKFACSSTFPCEGIVLQDIDLKLQAGKEENMPRPKV
ncbi:Glycoside hydrolase [Parasponia andersonii]|uniref:Glycoside hydrolase n=1 Tax=Parasponia andersonii TaxID=3476 RepID=A0A2P5AJ69_PARAD|nr:Glycoside hydrolase [Parasponia andersonii]